MNTKGLRNRSAWKDGAGFTLPEVLITIVVMGILAGIAVPSWFGIVESRRVDSAANQVAADLRLSHGRATNQLTDWRVVFRGSDPGGTLNKVNCGGTQADYCMVELAEVYDGGVGAPVPIVAQMMPRYLPEGTLITPYAPLPDPRTTVSADTGATQTVAPSVLGQTMTMEANSDGTVRTLGGIGGRFRVTSLDGDPSHQVFFTSATARVRID